MKNITEKTEILKNLYSLREHMNEALPLFRKIDECKENKKIYFEKQRYNLSKLIYCVSLFFFTWGSFIVLIKYLLKTNTDILNENILNIYNFLNVFNNIEYILIVFSILYCIICVTREKRNIKKYRVLYQEECYKYHDICDEIIKHYNKFDKKTPVTSQYCHPTWITEFIRELNEDNDLTIEEISKKVSIISKNIQ